MRGFPSEAFGRSRRWSVGVEEELLLVDERTLELVAAAPQLLEHGDERLKAELFEAMLETTSGICESAMEAAERLLAARRVAAERAAAVGARIAATGSHPFALPEEQSITDDASYRTFVEFAGPATRRQVVCGLHVHVGMPDGDTCVRAHEAVLPWLPLVLALSANSPWFRGERSGFVSKRAEVLGTLPRAGAAPAFATYAEWREQMERWLRAGVVDRITAAWWDARVHPALGTLELRIPDQPTDARRAGAFVALLQALAVHGARTEPRLAPRGDYTTNRFAAARFGPRAELLHPDADRLVPVPELLDELLARLDPVLDELGSRALLDPLDAETCEADVQLAAADPRAACAAIVERSLASRP